MAARRRRATDDHGGGHENHERWLVSYADMITLLMALFVILFSLGRLDLAKLERFRQGFVSGIGDTFGVLSGSGTGGPGIGAHQSTEGDGPGLLEGQPAAVSNESVIEQAAAEQVAKQVERQKLTHVQQQVVQKLKQLGLQRDVQFHLEERGLRVSVASDQVLFDLGRAELRPDGRQVLDGIAEAIKALPNRIVVEGHTDDRPIHGGPFPTNWELSTTRATTVLRYLVETHGFDPHRLAAAGYADTLPLAPNTSDANRDRNRRVEIIIVATEQSKSQSVGQAQTPTKQLVPKL